MVHFKCRNKVYQFSNIARLLVSDDHVPWSFLWDTYNPPEYTSEGLKGKPYADPSIGKSFKPKWNELDGNINRQSYTGKYQIIDRYPLNPEGRTGLRGRGLLGRWGPNHAADPVVTRWKRINGEILVHGNSKLPILEICVIQRRDSGEWALPGGMVDPGEKVTATLKREFLEEALNILEKSPEEKLMKEKQLNEFFNLGEEVYKGYVDDPRNTDNAWMETVAVNFHDEKGSFLGEISLQAGDDAKNVQWMVIYRDTPLYASHLQIVEKVMQLRKAHW